MHRRRLRFAPALSVATETLESRALLSTLALAPASIDVPHAHAEIATMSSVKKATTQTKLNISAGTLGAPITMNVTVQGPASAGSPEGTVKLVFRGQTFETLELTPVQSTNSSHAISQTSYVFAAPPGSNPLYFGSYSVTAKFAPSAGFGKSSVTKNFTVHKPAYTTLANGVKVATVITGSGPEIQNGQTATVFYTGYLAKTGAIFDDSANDGGAPFPFTLGAQEVVSGFNEGTIGMEVGETRIISIPPAQAYGSKAEGPIPPHSTLIFLVTLEAIS